MKSYMLAILFLGLVITIPAASQKKIDHPGAQYFPPGVFARGYSNGSFAADWFARQLKDMNEEPIWHSGQISQHLYRFLFLPSFSHPIMVRIAINPDGTASIESKIGKGAGGYAPKGINSPTSTVLSIEQTRAFLGVVESEEFWTQPSERKGASEGDDGTEWILEGSDKTYHIVDRWEGDSLRRLGTYILSQIAHIDPSKAEDPMQNPPVK